MTKGRSFGRQLPIRPRPQLQNRRNPIPQTDFAESHQTANEAENFLSLNSSSSGNILATHVMSGLAFEVFFLTYSLSALFTQYLFIYKTVWWYPPLLPPSSTTINIHLIDKSLTTFLVLLFLRRILWCAFWNYLRPASETGILVILWALFSATVFGLWIFEIGRSAISLLDRFKSYKVLFLFYPVFLWMFLNCFFESGCFQQMFLYFCKKNTKGRSQLLSKIVDHVDPSDEQKLSAQYEDAEQIREDIKQLCQDFNSKLCEVMFGSMVCSYYAGLVPMFFTESHHSYDFSWSLQHTALILFNSFIILAWHLMPPYYLESLHKFALLLGGYIVVEDDAVKEGNCQEIQDWSPTTVYPYGALVKYKSKTFVAFGKRNTAIPSLKSHMRYSFLFYTPLRVLDFILLLFSVVIVYQVYVILCSGHWDHVLAPSLLQFFSYYVLFMLLRDRVALCIHYEMFNIF